MRDYEVTVLLVPSLSEKDLEKALKNVEAFVSKAGGRMDSKMSAVKKPMAYQIKRITEANYVYFETSMRPEDLTKVNELLRNDDNVMRYLIVAK